MQKIIFITGTDTGVGKTVLTALLLSHLRQAGVPAFALKPFCSGRRADAELLHSLQNGVLTLDEINPFHFSEPVAPLVAARLRNRKLTLRQTLGHIQQLSVHLIEPSPKKSTRSKIRSGTPSLQSTTTPVLLIEGAGGLLAPLGENFNLLDLILATSSLQHTVSSIQVILVAPNRLGTINHTMLTVQALQSRDFRSLDVILMDVLSPQHSTPDTRSNPSILTELLFPIPLFRIPHLGKNPGKSERIQTFAKKYKKILAKILA